MRGNSGAMPQAARAASLRAEPATQSQAEPLVPIAVAREADFECGICGRMIEMRWNFRARIIPPICPPCEDSYSSRRGVPRYGSFRDRREVMRGFAVTEALLSTASIKQWEARHGKS